MLKRNTSRKYRQGGAVLEMALIAPILVMLTFGVIEYGYFTYVKNETFGAAADGAHAAALSTATTASVTTAVSNAMSNAGLSNTSYVVTISPSTLPATSGTPVSVTVSFNWGTVGISPLPTSMGGIASTKQVAATATMQAE